MGIFSGIRNIYKKSEATVVVQKLLEDQARVGWFELDPAKVASALVQNAWDQKPDIFNGKFGQRPHKIAVAAIALAIPLDAMGDNDQNHRAILIALGNVLLEVERNGRLYPLNSLDEQLLEWAVAVYAERAQKVDRKLW